MPKLIDHGERRAQIVHAAWAVAASNGVGAVTLRQVADDAGIVVGSLRHIFSSRDDCVFLLAATCYHRALRRTLLVGIGLDKSPRAGGGGPG
ncbi:TetR family transcriptional regulator [Microbacterium sp. MC2]